MKCLKVFLSAIALATVLSSCSKDDEVVRIPVRTYTVTLSMQPTDNAYTALDTAKRVFLSLSKGAVYNCPAASANSADIDLAVYDGTTTTTSIGDVHFVSPGGGTLSMNTAQGVYLYRDLGTTNSSVRFFDLAGMGAWTTYNTTNIRDESGMNGVGTAEFDAIQYTDTYNSTISKIQQPGTDNSNVAKKMLAVSNNTLVSNVWYFEFHSGGAKRTALARITDRRHMPDGYVTLQVKLLP